MQTFLASQTTPTRKLPLCRPPPHVYFFFQNTVFVKWESLFQMGTACFTGCLLLSKKDEHVSLILKYLVKLFGQSHGEVQITELKPAWNLPRNHCITFSVADKYVEDTK